MKETILPSGLSKENGVYILSEKFAEFESIYLKVREKENRIYSDKELFNLPFASDENPLKDEWVLRAKSFSRFSKYLGSKKVKLNIMDLGCGNGWFCGQLSKSFDHNFYCIDVNLTELKQGRRVYNSENLNFIYADIFSVKLPEKSFDLITINAAIQYFPDIKKLLHKLLPMLDENGELHIIDSPIYSEEEAINAKQRTSDYYSSLGFPEMSGKYFHHTWNDFQQFNYKMLFNPFSPFNRLKKIITSDSPFPWIRITN